MRALAALAGFCLLALLLVAGVDFDPWQAFQGRGKAPEKIDWPPPSSGEACPLERPYADGAQRWCLASHPWYSAKTTLCYTSEKCCAPQGAPCHLAVKKG